MRDTKHIIINGKTLAVQLDLHKLWLDGKAGGVRLSLPPKADLSNSDLRHADLSNSDLRNSNLFNTDLRNSDLGNTKMAGAITRLLKEKKNDY